MAWQVILNGAPIIDCESETEMADKLLALFNLGVFGTFDTREVKCKDCADHLLGCPVCTDQPAPATKPVRWIVPSLVRKTGAGKWVAEQGARDD